MSKFLINLELVAIKAVLLKPKKPFLEHEVDICYNMDCLFFIIYHL